MIRATDECSGLNPGRHSHYLDRPIASADLGNLIGLVRGHAVDADDDGTDLVPIPTDEADFLCCTSAVSADSGEPRVILWIEGEDDASGEPDEVRFALSVADARRLRVELDACLDAIDDEACEGI